MRPFNSTIYKFHERRHTLIGCNGVKLVNSNAVNSNAVNSNAVNSNAVNNGKHTNTPIDTMIGLVGVYLVWKFVRIQPTNRINRIRQHAAVWYHISRFIVRR